MDEGAPRASISLFAGRRLELVESDGAQLLRAGETVVARLTSTLAETADGRWRLANPRGAHVDAYRDGSGESAARYRPGPIGGSIRIVGAGSYAVRPPALGSAWKLRRGRGGRLIAKLGGLDVHLATAAAEEPALALLLVVALRAVTLEDSMPGLNPGAPSP